MKREFGIYPDALSFVRHSYSYNNLSSHKFQIRLHGKVLCKVTQIYLFEIRFGCRHLRDLLLIIGIMPLQVKPLLKISPA